MAEVAHTLWYILLLHLLWTVVRILELLQSMLWLHSLEISGTKVKQKDKNKIWLFMDLHKVASFFLFGKNVEDATMTCKNGHLFTS